MSAFDRMCGFVSSLAGRIAMFLTLGTSCGIIGALLISDIVRRSDLEAARLDRVVASSVDVLNRMHRAREDTLKRFQDRHLIGSHLVSEEIAQHAKADMQLTARVIEQVPNGNGVTLGELPSDQCLKGDPFWKEPHLAGFSLPVESACNLLRIPLDKGDLLVSIDVPRVIDPPSSATEPIFLILVFLVTAGVSILVAGGAITPLRRLSAASRAFANSIDAPPVTVDGPSDVREALSTFNLMQERVREGLRERTQLLAGISHDLQTPLTRLRLRLEKVQDVAFREQLIADLSTTLVMIRRGLDLARSTESTDDWSIVDLDSLLAAAVQDARDAGQEVNYGGRCRARVRIRPDALSRCIVNLIDNAVKYGGNTLVRCTSDPVSVIVSVEDDGPGMAPELLERAFEPFVRGKEKIDGTGIGLTIARAQASATGGSLALRNKKGGGLIAELTLQAESRV